MTVPVAVLELWDLHAGVFRDAPLYTPIADRHVVEFESHWRPALASRAAGTHGTAERMAAQVQDDHWDWDVLAKSATGRTDRLGFAVECEERLQGLMILDLTKRGRVATQRNQHLVYVDRLVTAPQNRIGFSSNRRFKGVGTVLMITAIQHSIDEGFMGRVGLHSLPQSEGFYRDVCSMVDLGPDPDPYYRGLRYFEMTPQLANQFLDNPA